MSPPPPYSVGEARARSGPVAAISLTTLEHPLAELVARHLDRVVEDAGVLGEVLADQVADLGVLAVEQRGQRGDVDVGLRTVGHGPTLPHASARRVTSDSRAAT